MEKEIVQLLIADIEVGMVIVKIPNFEIAVPGDLVEFTYGDRDIVGTVLRTTTCEKEKCEFISFAKTIYDAKNLWHRVWNKDDPVEDLDMF